MMIFLNTNKADKVESPQFMGNSPDEIHAFFFSVINSNIQLVDDFVNHDSRIQKLDQLKSSITFNNVESPSTLRSHSSNLVHYSNAFGSNYNL